MTSIKLSLKEKSYFLPVSQVLGRDLCEETRGLGIPSGLRRAAGKHGGDGVNDLGLQGHWYNTIRGLEAALVSLLKLIFNVINPEEVEFPRVNQKLRRALCIKQKTSDVLEWPARSLDLDLIEHFKAQSWDLCIAKNSQTKAVYVQISKIIFVFSSNVIYERKLGISQTNGLFLLTKFLSTQQK